MGASISIGFGGGGPPRWSPAPSEPSFLRLESLDRILLESGDHIRLEH